MKKSILSIIAMLGLSSACAQPTSSRPTVADNSGESFVTPGGKQVVVHPLVHASIRMEFDGKQIYIDPVTNLNGRTFDFAKMPKADNVIITHEHHDHFDKNAVNALSTANTCLIATKKCAAEYGAGISLANGDSVIVADNLSIKAVAAYNTTAGHLRFHPKGIGNGYILNFDGLRVYVAGDTEVIPEMSEFGKINVAFLPCNQPYTMTPDQLVEAAKILKPTVLYPYHFSDTDLSGIPARLQPLGIDVRILSF